MKYLVFVVAVLFLSGCSLTKTSQGALPGENFSRSGSCGTVNCVKETKKWGCLWNR